MSVESTKKTIGIAVSVGLVCSLLVSTAVVTLRPLQKRNKEIEKIKNVLQAADIYDPKADLREQYNKRIQGVMIDINTFEAVPSKTYEKEINIQTYSIKDMLKKPKLVDKIPKDLDIAGIKKKPKWMLIYLVKEGEDIQQIILPIYGKGLWSTMYGLLALDFNDIATIRGITFYEHGETPGLGGEVDNPLWKKLWKGKKAFNDQGELVITVLKGVAPPNSTDKIDGLSGATITARGINQLVRFWLGDTGFGPLLKKLREQPNGKNKKDLIKPSN